MRSSFAAMAVPRLPPGFGLDIDDGAPRSTRCPRRSRIGHARTNSAERFPGAAKRPSGEFLFRREPMCIFLVVLRTARVFWPAQGPGGRLLENAMQPQKPYSAAC